MNPLQPNTFAPDFTAVAARCGLRVATPSPWSLTFVEAPGEAPLKGSVAAVTRNRYRDSVRRQELIGFRVIMECAAITSGRIVIAEKRLCSRFTRWLNRLAGLRRMQSPTALAHLEIWTADPTWAGRLLANDVIVSRIAALIPPKNALRHAGLHWHPDRLLFAPSASAETILTTFDGWQQLLHELAELAAAQQPPVPVYTPHWLETHARWMPFIVLFGGVLLLGLMLLLALALVFLLTYLNVF